MADRRIVAAIKEAIRSGRMEHRFLIGDFRRACPGFAPATYGTFPPKHREGNPGGNTVLFRRVGRGEYVFLPDPEGE